MILRQSDRDSRESRPGTFGRRSQYCRVLIRVRPLRQRPRVTQFLARQRNAAARPPHRGMEEEQGFEQSLQQHRGPRPVASRALPRGPTTTPSRPARPTSNQQVGSTSTGRLIPNSSGPPTDSLDWRRGVCRSRASPHNFSKMRGSSPSSNQVSPAAASSSPAAIPPRGAAERTPPPIPTPRPAPRTIEDAFARGSDQARPRYLAARLTSTLGA